MRALPREPVAPVMRMFDPSSVDQGQDFVWQIDWNGDGTFEETTLPGPDGTTVTVGVAGIRV